MRRAALIGLLALAACDRSPAQKVAMPETSTASAPAPLPLPTTVPGAWQAFGPERAAYQVDGRPILSLRCLKQGDQWRFEVVHHAAPEPGAQALLALIGNRKIARLPVDAQVGVDPGWIGGFDPRDPRLEVFSGGAGIEATLPGGGTTKMPASPVPSEFLAACIAASPPPKPDLSIKVPDVDPTNPANLPTPGGAN